MTAEQMTAAINLLVEAVADGKQTQEGLSRAYLKELFKKYQEQPQAGFVTDTQSRGWTVR